MRILVTTPNGHVGSRVIQRLTGHADIAVFVRDPARITVQNVVVHKGDLEDAAALAKAAVGADAMFFLIPPKPTVKDWAAFMHEVTSNAAQAIRANNVKHVVFISSFGAQLPNLGPISMIGREEETLRAVAPNLTILRAAYFMENLLQSVPTVRDASTVYNVFAPDFQLPMVATRDVGDAAAERLLDLSWSGQSIRGLQGPADITFMDVTRAIGQALNRPITYVQATVDMAEGGMRAAGLSEAVATGYGEMLRGMIKLGGRGLAAEPRSRESTTPTTIDEFARTVFAPAVQQAESVHA
ncbi:MAG TPA: NAD(P)H-binding protein [Gemmatimonadaceae bacterium]|nr:NAD(P)H-binding protein [Gemmatimonadaceae bacterium]